MRQSVHVFFVNLATYTFRINHGSSKSTDYSGKYIELVKLYIYNHDCLKCVHTWFLTAGFGSKKDGVGELSASQIASLHTTVQLQHKHHAQQQHHESSSQQPSHRLARSQQPPTTASHKSPGDLSEHEISHASRNNLLENISLLQSPARENNKLFHSRMRHSALENPVQAFREHGSGVQPLRLQLDGHTGNGMGNERQNEIPRLEQDPDRSFEESFVDGRGYTSGDFQPLKAVTRSPSKILNVLIKIFDMYFRILMLVTLFSALIKLF